MKNRIGRNIVVLLLCIAASVMLMEAAAVKAAEKRLSSDVTELSVQRNAAVKITLADRKEGEELTVSLKKKDAAEIIVGEWYDDTIMIAIVPLTETSTVMTVKAGGETVKIKLFLRVHEVKDAEDIYRSCAPAVVELKITDSTGYTYIGTGFFISQKKILTNYHVVEYASNIEITDGNGKKYNASKVYDYDKVFDLAVISSSTAFDGLPLSFAYDDVKTGDMLYSIGSPLEFSRSLSDGIVSYKLRVLDKVEYVQVTTPTSLGSGGGPLLNEYGEVVAVTTLTVSAAQNLNLAVPVHYFRELEMDSPRDIYSLYAENRNKAKPRSTYTITIG